MTERDRRGGGGQGGEGIFIMHEGLGVICVRGVSLMWCTTKTCKKVHMYIFLCMIHKWAHDVALEGLGVTVCLCLKKQKKTSLMRLEGFSVSVLKQRPRGCFCWACSRKIISCIFSFLRLVVSPGVARCFLCLLLLLGCCPFFVFCFYIWTTTGFYLFIFNVEKCVYPFQWTAPI